jgi:gluconate 2-dehydrogenase subunit 3-like protein
VTPETVAAARGLLALVLDTLVPPSDGFPGAGAVALDHVLAMAAASADLERLLSHGLGAVKEASGAHDPADLAALSVDDRESVLRRVEQSHPEFFEALVRHTYDGYYSHPTVIARLGLDASPLHPRGHHVETVDLADLARVRARGPIYRPA